jgi:hypothetical protein
LDSVGDHNVDAGRLGEAAGGFKTGIATARQCRASSLISARGPGRIAPDRETRSSYRTTNRLNREELLGALIVQTDLLRKELRDDWDDD